MVAASPTSADRALRCYQAQPGNDRAASSIVAPGATAQGAMWESIPQCLEETVDFFDAAIRLSAPRGRPMLAGASPHPAGSPEFAEILKLDDAEATDQVAEDLLRILGVPAENAREICQRPLPDIEDLTEPGSAA